MDPRTAARAVAGGGDVLAVALSTSAVATVLVADSGAVLAADAAARALGVMPTADHRVSRWVVWPRSSTWREVWSMALDEGVVELEGHLQVSDGARRSVRLLVECVDGGAPRALVRIWCRPYADDRRPALADVDGPVQRRRRLESMSRLAGAMAHDFNNLLTVIRSNAELLRMADGDAERASDELEQIIDATGRGAALTRELLACAGRLPARPSSLRLGRAVRDMAPALARELADGIELVVPDHAGPLVRVDPRHLRVMVRELVANGARAMSDRGRLTLAVDEVHRPGRRSDAPPMPWGRLRVIDDGVGMSPEAVARAFEPFFTTGGNSERRGLGLAACRGRLLLSGGRLSLDSAPGRGTVVEVLLPLCRAPSPSAPVPGRPTPEGLILLVEPVEGLRRIAHRSLVAAGHTVVVAVDASEAVGRVREGALFDLAIVGLEPRTSGRRRLMEALRQRWPTLPILSAASRPGPWGPSAWLMKPYGPRGLLRQVEALLAAAAGDRLTPEG